MKKTKLGSAIQQILGLAVGASLLPSGISAVSGDFDKGDAVLVLNMVGQKLAQGISQYSALELSKIRGVKSQQIDSILGYCPSEVAIHRDDLVLLN